MKSLLYDPKCKTCRIINFVSTFFVEIILGIIIGFVVTGLLQFLILILLAQPLVWGACWITNKIQPMVHHMFEENK